MPRYRVGCILTLNSSIGDRLAFSRIVSLIKLSFYDSTTRAVIFYSCKPVKKRIFAAFVCKLRLDSSYTMIFKFSYKYSWYFLLASPPLISKQCILLQFLQKIYMYFSSRSAIRFPHSHFTGCFICRRLSCRDCRDISEAVISPRHRPVWILSAP